MTPPSPRHFSKNVKKSSSFGKVDLILITCEHAGNHVPGRYRHLFRGHEMILETHRGYDIGALSVARHLAAELGAPLFSERCSRLVIDLNRSEGSRSLFSEFSQGLPEEDKEHLLNSIYRPYRESVVELLKAKFATSRRLHHISVHSFTPIFEGETRTADLALLYDPRRSLEDQLCQTWTKNLKCLFPDWTIRKNYPYRGTSDGFTTGLRRLFPAHRYAGIEIEINQRFFTDQAPDSPRVSARLLAQNLSRSFLEALNHSR